MLKAIIVDDEPAVARIIEYFIDNGKLPIEIVGKAENGLEAIELLEKNEVKLIFLDIHMPFMDGFKVMERFPNKNYIIITAYDTFEYAQRALRLGAKDLLLKPIDFKQLQQSITRAIGWNFTDNPILNDILEYINEYYYSEISLSSISDEFFITPSHISRLFKKYLGTTALTYLNELRIEKAISLLTNKDVAIKDVAEQVGYKSLNNFYKYFKEFTNSTPAEYLSRNK